jgi:hypothetical protein
MENNESINQNVESDIVQSEASQPEQAQAIPEPRQAKIEVDGSVLQINETQLKQLWGIDPNEPVTDKEFKSMVSAYKAQKTADIRTQQASKQAKLVQEISQLIQENPFELLQRAGYNPRELAERYLAQAIEEEMLPESERELKRVRAEKEQLQRQLEEEQKRIQSEQEQQAIQYAQQEITNQIITALEDDKAKQNGSGLPITPDVVKRIAQYMYMAEQKGINLHPKHIIPIVDQDLRNLNAQIIKSMDSNSRINYLGEDVLKQIRQDDLARLKQPINNGASKPQQKPMAKRMTKEEFRKEIANRIKS